MQRGNLRNTESIRWISSKSSGVKRIFTVILILHSLFCALHLQAQDDVEYRMELGVGANLTSYQGDFSNSLFGKMQPGGSVLFRAILNPRSAMRINAMVSKLKGDVSKSGTIYPDVTELNYSFSNTLVDVSASYEYNFLPYGTGRDYRGAKRFTPFVSLGIGLTYVNSKGGTYDYGNGSGDSDFHPQHSESKTVITGNIPIGLGVKYKLGDRTNISFDWQMHVSFSDKLDGIDDPYRINSSGLFKNTDCYSAFTLALTYSLSPKCSTCHKDR